jgi:hypothetical protein
MSELVKLISCLWLVYHEEGNSISKLKEAVHTQIIKQPLDTLKVCVPSMVYVVQNNLLYVAASHLDAATYQVSLKKKKNFKIFKFLKTCIIFLGDLSAQNSYHCPLYGCYIEEAVDSYSVDSVGCIACRCRHGIVQIF